MEEAQIGRTDPSNPIATLPYIAADVGGQAALFKKPSNTVKAYSSLVEDSASQVNR
jgi:hypothetical protein